MCVCVCVRVRAFVCVCLCVNESTLFDHPTHRLIADSSLVLRCEGTLLQGTERRFADGGVSQGRLQLRAQ